MAMEKTTLLIGGDLECLWLLVEPQGRAEDLTVVLSGDVRSRWVTLEGRPTSLPDL